MTLELHDIRLPVCADFAKALAKPVGTPVLRPHGIAPDERPEQFQQAARIGGPACARHLFHECASPGQRRFHGRFIFSPEVHDGEFVRVRQFVYQPPDHLSPAVKTILRGRKRSCDQYPAPGQGGAR